MSKKIIAHVGFHKTGTTALQGSFSHNRKMLREAGILYPRLGQKAQHRAAWALTERYWGWNKRGGTKFPIAEWEKLVKFSRKFKGTTLFSSEFFCELDETKIRKFKKDLDNEDVTIVFTLRPLVKLLASSYQQYLKYGITPTYEEWLHAVLDKPGKSKVTPTFWKRHEHGRVITQWANVFGAENVVVVIADEKNPEAIFDAFNSLLGFPAKTISQLEGVASNRSLSNEEVQLLLEVNRKFPKERTWDDYDIFIRDGWIRHLTDKVTVSPSAEKLLTPQWAVDKAREFGADSVEQIKASGVKIVGNIDTFALAEIPVGENLPVTHIPISLAADALLAFDKRTIRRFGSHTFVREAKRRVKKKLRNR